MRKAAAVLRSRRAEFAALMADEMGKPVSDGLAEVDKCATACEHYAATRPSYLAREPRRPSTAPRPSSPSTRSASCSR